MADSRLPDAEWQHNALLTIELGNAKRSKDIPQKSEYQRPFARMAAR